MERWLAGTIKLETPAPFPSQSSSGDERDPWISSDGLRLYYSLNKPGTTNKADIYLATRGSSAQPFGAGAPITNLNTLDDESRPSFSGDEKIVAVSSSRGGGKVFNILTADRGSATGTFGSPDNRYTMAINGAGQHYDPFLTQDGLTVYLAPDPDGSSQHIARATRTSLTANFSAATPVPVINGTAGGDADPALSLDERIIVFTSLRATGLDDTGSTNLWYATRPDTAHEFGAPRPIPDVNSDVQDGDPILSADGCTLYFSSRRGAGNTYDLYSASVETVVSAVPPLVTSRRADR